MKKIAVLTSGGDAPGMNAAIRAVVRTAISQDVEVLGVRRGYNGLIHNDMKELRLRSVSDIIHRGGTMLYTARSKKFNSPEGVALAAKVCNERGIEGVVAIGGDGTFRGAGDLAAHGIKCVGVPCTIDNDIGCSEYAIGYDTALNTCIEMIDKIRDTAQSHDRCSVVEVMGHKSGFLALNVGLAAGATSIAVPEMEFDFQRDVIERIRTTKRKGKKHFIIIVAEAVGKVDEMSDQIYKETRIVTRPTILGHVQRGGSPTVKDRVIASQMGHEAAEMLIAGKSMRVVALKGSEIVDYDIAEALQMKKPFDEDLFRMAHQISI